MKAQQRDEPFCLRCGKEVSGRWSFSFKSQNSAPSAGNDVSKQEVLKCLNCALLHLPMLKRSAVAGLVVGTILTLLNQGDLLISGQWNNALFWKIPLTYCVPFLVASYGALTNSRR